MNADSVKAKLKKKRAMKQVEFGAVVEAMKTFLEPVVKKLKEQELLEADWDFKEKTWRY